MSYGEFPLRLTLSGCRRDVVWPPFFPAGSPKGEKRNLRIEKSHGLPGRIPRVISPLVAAFRPHWAFLWPFNPVRRVAASQRVILSIFFLASWRLGVKHSSISVNSFPLYHLLLYSFTLPHLHTFTLSHLHTFILSHLYTFTLSLPKEAGRMS